MLLSPGRFKQPFAFMQFSLFRLLLCAVASVAVAGSKDEAQDLFGLQTRLMMFALLTELWENW